MHKTTLNRKVNPSSKNKQRLNLNVTCKKDKELFIFPHTKSIPVNFTKDSILKLKKRSWKEQNLSQRVRGRRGNQIQQAIKTARESIFGPFEKKLCGETERDGNQKHTRGSSKNSSHALRLLYRLLGDVTLPHYCCIKYIFLSDGLI